MTTTHVIRRKVPPLHVVAGVIRRGDRYLMQQRSAKRDYPFMWESPGGKVERGENLEGALWRELVEEIGLGSHALTLPCEKIFDVELDLDLGRPVVLTFFRVFVNEAWIPQTLDAAGRGWFTLAEMEAMIPGNVELLRRLLAERAASAPGSR